MSHETWIPKTLQHKEHNFLGKLIAFEGLDGSGKSSLAQLTSEYLAAQGIDNMVTKIPTNEVRQTKYWMEFYSNPSYEHETVDPFGISLLIFADRILHISNAVVPALKRGVWVICDRYVLSSFVYHFSEVHINLASRILEPDLKILVDVEGNESARRVKKRGEHETESEIQSKNDIRNRYLKLAEKNKYAVVNTTNQSAADSFSQILPLIKALDPNRIK